ncbi:MAG: hypothetical protein NXI13_16090 [Proteobacteria bacterium]|nr:hypothetical protein [Pseudomonadota bacterium]
MRRFQANGKNGIAVLLCLSLVIWSAIPPVSHMPSVLDTLQEHLEMVEDHGHSHGLEEDLFWALHGHSHDKADHDHSQAFFLLGSESFPTTWYSETWRLKASENGPSPQFRIDRPPRA